MDWFALALIALSGKQFTGLFVQPLSVGGMVRAIGGDRPTAVTASEPLSAPPKMTHRQLYERSRLITVKVMAGNSWGSGILVQQQGQHYSVLTNHHVLNPGQPYFVQTPDHRIYSAELLQGSKFQHRDHFLGNDLEILQFSTSAHYEVALLNPTENLTVGEEVFAAGFPTEIAAPSAKGFAFTTGRISLLQAQAFVGGYRIGSTDLIHKGMSGGPLLNRRGEVVGINGLHAYPIWGNPYVFPDGSLLPPQTQAEVARSSWAIPIATFICLAPLTGMSLSVPIQRQEVCSEQ
ncbi:serine protease [Kovacikia minuta CCNUW1]|uniref:S1 family peptidase n=1 Tax=Kovacikia minuta TaxID=2931930 RepID=UPI001CCC3290|nr:serine protease [Kovacikia minuta]UBF28390.1 serine protease [Kovacikia minuta CCNUW1]